MILLFLLAPVFTLLMFLSDTIRGGRHGAAINATAAICSFLGMLVISTFGTEQLFLRHFSFLRDAPSRMLSRLRKQTRRL
jgi:hypothetical protein